MQLMKQVEIVARIGMTQKVIKKKANRNEGLQQDILHGKPQRSHSQGLQPVQELKSLNLPKPHVYAIF